MPLSCLDIKLCFSVLSSGEIIDFILTLSLSISFSKGLMNRQINELTLQAMATQSEAGSEKTH